MLRRPAATGSRREHLAALLPPVLLLLAWTLLVYSLAQRGSGSAMFGTPAGAQQGAVSAQPVGGCDCDESALQQHRAAHFTLEPPQLRGEDGGAAAGTGAGLAANDGGGGGAAAAIAPDDHDDATTLTVRGSPAAVADDADDADATPRVLILTPVKNSASHLRRYFDNLARLDYPPARLALGLLDSDSDDAPPADAVARLRALASTSRPVARFLAAAGVLAEDGGGGNATRRSRRHHHARLSGTMAALLLELPALLTRFGRVTLVQHDFGLALSREARHGQAAQRARRAVMARSRNHLLASALAPGDGWVLWVDSDLHSYPADTLRRLLRGRRQIVVPNCVMAPGGRSYDLNSWRLPGLGNNASVEQVAAAHDAVHAAAVAAGHPHELHLEGYGPTGARYLHHLRREAGGGDPDAVVRLDAVGGAMLLVDAELHRHGLAFPAYPHRHRIETEGLSMMALDMGVLVRARYGGGGGAGWGGAGWGELRKW
jgi:hypothetical protein